MDACPHNELGWIDNPTQLTAGLRNFYQETEVQPHLYITDTVNGSHSPSPTDLDLFANNLYDQLFTDEAHLLLVFFEYNESYMTRYVAGTQAKTVIDSEAADILLDYIDRYYYDDSLTDMAELNMEPIDDAKALEEKYASKGTASVDEELAKMKEELGKQV